MRLTLSTRPQTFSEVLGQDTTVNILKKSIELDRVFSVVIFSGRYGCGKTTMARIYAKAINCENPQNGEPCNECRNCLAISKNATTDFLEVDAASNRSIDNIREIQKSLTVVRIMLKYKTFILDECHSLTPEAWQSLLKPLEQARNAVFIFCTTEAERVPQTVLSRAIHLRVNPIQTQVLSTHLRSIADSLGVEISDEALRVLAINSDGVLRNAVKNLDLVVSTGQTSDKQIDEVFASNRTQGFINILKGSILQDTKQLEQIYGSVDTKASNQEEEARAFHKFLAATIRQKLLVESEEDFSHAEQQQITEVLKNIRTSKLLKMEARVRGLISTQYQYMPTMSLVLAYLIAERKKELQDEENKIKQDIEFKRKQEKEVENVLADL